MGKRILIIDDDIFIRELYEEILQDAGFVVDSAGDGEEGLAKLKEGGYNLVLLDIIMPKIDGPMVLEAIKKSSPKSPNGPIVMLSNLSHDPVMQSTLQNGASSCLVKANLTPGQLVERVKKVVGE